MSQPADTQEPSMEEILASIRRIISEDGATVEPAPTEDAMPLDTAQDAQPDVLDLTEQMQPDGSVAPVETAPVIEMAEEVPPTAATPRPPLGMPAFDTLLSETAAAAAGSKLNSLAGLMRSQSPGVNSLPIGDGARTLESMTLELIRPILKDWLDRNLPTLVEKVVQKEIQKLTRDLR